MKKKLFLITPLLISVMLISCTPKQELELSIIPKPHTVEVGNEKFTITPQTKLISDNQLEDIANVVEYLNGYLSKSAGYEL